MKCSDAQIKMVELIYEELSAADREALDRHLESCSDCRRDLEELKESRSMLSAWEDTREKVTFVFAERRAEAPRRTWLRKAFTYAGAAAAVIVMALGLSTVRVSWEDGDFYFSAGRAESAQEQGDMYLTRAEFETALRDQMLLTSQIIDEKYREQSADNYLVMNQLVKGLQIQREDDMEVILASINQYQTMNNEKLYETNRNFLDLLQYTGVEIHRDNE